MSICEKVMEEAVRYDDLLREQDARTNCPKQPGSYYQTATSKSEIWPKNQTMVDKNSK